MPDNALMDKRKKGTDRHQPRKLAGIRKQLIEPLEKLAQRNATDFTEEVNRAVRELLEREHLWPPHE